MKRILAFVLAAILAFSAFAMMGYADGQPVTAYIANSYDEENGYGRAIDWYNVNDKYYFFVPASIDYEAAKLYISGTYTVDGAEYTAPETLATVFGDKTEVKVTAEGGSYDVVIIKESKTASVFIETESGSLDFIHAVKGNEEEGTIEIVDVDGKVLYDGALEIKGRGNSTWQMEKKPYNIKLDKKTDLFGMGKTKKWSLIANHTDLSLIRNVLAYEAAKAAGMPYTPQFEPVDVYINREYKGSYLLTTRVGIDGTSVDVEDLEGNTEDANKNDLDTYPKAGYYGTYAGLLAGTKKWYDIPNDPEDITGGYIIEMELANRYADEACGFVTDRDQPFTMKTPEYVTKAQIDYISGLYQKFEDAVYAGADMAEIGKYCNVQSLAQLYLINEWASNMDGGLTSTYFYKPEGENETLYGGPVWDFDIAFGNNDAERFGNDYNDPSKWTVCYNRMYRNTVFGKWDIDEQPNVFNIITKNEGFVDVLDTVWNGAMKSAVAETIEWVETEYAPSVEGSAVANAIRWNIFGTHDVDEIKKAYADEVKAVVKFAKTKAETITAGVGEVQNDAPETNAVVKFFKGFLVGINDIFEKAIVALDLVNKI
ncbi:MAG: CotH kinase family protein [Clostridia bacterium]|nr:CotH kinase family protein [Clostridia bacterium]